MYLFEGMSKKDKIGFIIVFLLMATFFFAMLFFSLGKPSVDYYWVAMILSIIATFFIDKNSSSRGLKFTLVLTCFIVYVFCKGVKNIPFSETQLTIIDGVTEGILVYFVAPPLLKISWSVLKVFGLFIEYMSKEETSESNNEHPLTRIQSIQNKIDELERERWGLTTTYDPSMDIIDHSNYSESKIKRNRKRDEYLVRQIKDLEDQLKESEEQLRRLRR